MEHGCLVTQAEVMRLLTNTYFSTNLPKPETLGERSLVGLKTTQCMLLTLGLANDLEDAEGKK